MMLRRTDLKSRNVSWVRPSNLPINRRWCGQRTDGASPRLRALESWGSGESGG